MRLECIGIPESRPIPALQSTCPTGTMKSAVWAKNVVRVRAFAIVRVQSLERNRNMEDSAGVSQWGKNKVLPSCTSRLAQLTTASGTPTHSCVKTGMDFGKLLISHITASSLVLKGLWMFRLCTGGLQVQAWDVAQRFISDLFKYFISDVSGATEREKATEILQRSEPAAAYFPMSQ